MPHWLLAQGFFAAHLDVPSVVSVLPSAPYQRVIGYVHEQHSRSRAASAIARVSAILCSDPHLRRRAGPGNMRYLEDRWERTRKGLRWFGALSVVVAILAAGLVARQLLRGEPWADGLSAIPVIAVLIALIALIPNSSRR